MLEIVGEYLAVQRSIRRVSHREAIVEVKGKNIPVEMKGSSDECRACSADEADEDLMNEIIEASLALLYAATY